MARKKTAKLRIRVSRLKEVPNVCNQRLREVYKNERASLAHVEVEPGGISLYHDHAGFQEWYYILSGRGRMRVGDTDISVRGNDLVVVDPKTGHQLINVGYRVLKHLVFSSPPFDPADVNLQKED